ncbi:MAG: hypothetical protein LBI72_01265 [Flavobacteriaceae bacterium]|jgi:hypothetical protein|nr:hypothetical protein [Flavobacteriaceae bacterium]
MKEEKVFLYGSKMAISLLIMAAICLSFSLVLGYSIFRKTVISLPLLLEFWKITLLVFLFVYFGLNCLVTGIRLLRNSANNKVILRLTTEGITNYKRNITLKWSDIDDVIFISYRNRYGIGVKMKDKELLFNQLPFYSRLPNRLFGLSVFDALSGEYIKGDGHVVYREIKEYFDQL